MQRKMNIFKQDNIMKSLKMYFNILKENKQKNKKIIMKINNNKNKKRRIII